MPVNTEIRRSAMEHFSCQLSFDVKKSAVSTWKMKYLAVAMAT